MNGQITMFFFLEQSCNPVTISYDGFIVEWNKTLAGVTVEASCTGPGLNGQLQCRYVY